MIENIIGSGVNPIEILPWIGTGFAGLAFVYSLYRLKKGYSNRRIDGHLNERDCSALRYLKKRGKLKEDKNQFYVPKNNLTPYDLERLAKE